MRWAVLIAVVALVVLPETAAAHDDPVVTVRVMSNGFNVLDMDAVLGEISNTATVTLDQTIKGDDQGTVIQAWVQHQMDEDLRIEIVDMGTPSQLPDGYALNWTGRFSREDWREAGMQERQVSNHVVIHNGRITEWTASFDAAGQAGDPGAPAPEAGVILPQPASDSPIPELFGIPVTLLFVATAIVAAGSLALLKRPR